MASRRDEGVSRLLLIEDDAIMGESLLDRFELEGFRVRWSRSIVHAAALLDAEPFDAVVSDVRLPDGSGESLFEKRQRMEGTPLPWLFITAFASVDRAVAMLQAGARDYVTKPFDIAELVEKVRAAVGDGGAGHAFALSQSQSQSPGLASAEGSETLGTSAAMRRLAAQAERVARRARTVLITGESGAGKEVLARHLHALAHAQPETPFVAVNCGAIPEALVEAALFGHERGAFTGAERQRRGYVEQAQGGTLFLDEIAELTPAMQVRLLRVLQDRQVQRLGAESAVPVDLRVTCATHRDLQQLVQQGRFREDLYYRIHVVHLKVPPLRDRPEDVLWLAQRFLRKQASERGEPARRLGPAARAALLGHPWPGNVRELHNRIERACVMSEQPEVTEADLFEEREAPGDASQLPTLEHFVADAEKAYLSAVLMRFDGRVGLAAQALGISRKTLWEKSKRYGLRADD
jgi:DNA-binding NtrC family response regulator